MAVQAGDRNFDQPLHHIRATGDRHSQTDQQGEAERGLDDDDRDERIDPLPRPHRSSIFGVCGHDPRPLAAASASNSAGVRSRCDRSRVRQPHRQPRLPRRRECRRR